jgi:hypothetical protein
MRRPRRFCSMATASGQTMATAAVDDVLGRILSLSRAGKMERGGGLEGRKRGKTRVLKWVAAGIYREGTTELVRPIERTATCRHTDSLPYKQE